ncbi:MAG: hypothetical protein A2X48_13110 [Lentisphaerae bacterium GWF2_49_21]|nr:MAG: hypothetical protein A2X48_13110 [Lentisphaerae bacterium GWF2_49_21]
MKINEEIFQALRKAVFEAGSQSSFADISKVSKQNIHRYLKRKVNCIDDDKWENLEPLLKPHMPRKEINLEDLKPDERILLEKYRELNNLQKKQLLEKAMEDEIVSRIPHFKSAAGE